MIQIKTISGLSNIKDYYFVTTCGKIISTYSGINIMSPSMNNAGYKIIGLRDTSGNRKCLLVHKIVASAFIENDDLSLVVNHKNEIKTDNNIQNLEFITQKENINHGNSLLNKDNSNRRRRAIVQIFDDGTEIEWESASMASSELSIDRSLIVGACNGRYKKANKTKWRYK